MLHKTLPKYETIEHFICECSSPEHTLVFTLDEYTGDIEDLEIYTSVFLDQYKGFFGRLWTAIKYLFGYKCRYGHWDCFIMRDQDVERLEMFLNKYKDLREKLTLQKKNLT